MQRSSDSALKKDRLDLPAQGAVYTFPGQAIPADGDGRAGRFYPAAKRLLDLLCSAAALLLLWPLLLVTAIAIKLDSKGPVLFRQVRVGKDKQPFTMYKFRSMCDRAERMQKDLADHNERDGPVFKIKHDPRVTRVGAVLRKTCIDELPQLINVLKGEMSLVGPRPPLPDEVRQYTPYHLRRLTVIPGLTCYWQVTDRDVSFDQWVEMDIRYIRERSLILDLRLIFSTFAVIFRKRGDQ